MRSLVQDRFPAANRMAKVRFLSSRLRVVVGSKDPWLWGQELREWAQDPWIYTHLAGE